MPAGAGLGGGFVADLCPAAVGPVCVMSGQLKKEWQTWWKTWWQTLKPRHGGAPVGG